MSRPIPATPHSGRTLTVLAFIAFISLGLPDTLLGVAWPSIRTAFDRPISSLGLLAAFGTAGYLSCSFLAGSIVTRVGVGRLLVASCAIVTLSLALYAVSPFWPVLFIAAYLGGIGAGAIDSGVNAFAARAFSPRVLNWMHACWGIGATLGPLVMTAAIDSRYGWRLGYGVVGVVMIALTTLFLATVHVWRIEPTVTDAAGEPVATSTLAQAARQRNVQLQTLFYFVYGGVEFGTGNWLFTLLTESRGIAIATAGTVVGLFWASLATGRITFGQLAHHYGAVRVLRLGLGGAVVGAACLIRVMPAGVWFAGAALLGFALAPLFPTTISQTPRRVGDRYAAHSVSFQVSAAGLGIAVWSGLIGVVARSFSIEVLPYALLMGLGILIALHECVERNALDAAPRASGAAPVVE